MGFRGLGLGGRGGTSNRQKAGEEGGKGFLAGARKFCVRYRGAKVYKGDQDRGAGGAAARRTVKWG